MEKQTEYGDKPLPKLCPVMSRTHIVSIARGAGRQGMDIQIKPARPVGL